MTINRIGPPKKALKDSNPLRRSSKRIGIPKKALKKDRNPLRRPLKKDRNPLKKGPEKG